MTAGQETRRGEPQLSSREIGVQASALIDGVIATLKTDPTIMTQLADSYFEDEGWRDIRGEVSTQRGRTVFRIQQPMRNNSYNMETGVMTRQKSLFVMIGENVHDQVSLSSTTTQSHSGPEEAVAGKIEPYNAFSGKTPKTNSAKLKEARRLLAPLLQ